jgi:putative sigma-54 modulation protein
MKINIQSRQVELDKDIEAHIQRKLKLAFSRVEHNITSIYISLSDVTSKIGLSNTHCHLQIGIIDMPDMVIEDTQSDLYFAIDRVLQKASHSLTRKLISAGKKDVQ